MSDLRTAALGYASLGWHVFPCKPAILGDDTSGKDPIPQCCPHGWHDATTNPNLISEWWTRFPDANIGIATAPSGLVVLDVDEGIDRKTGLPKEGFKSLATFNDRLVPTLTAQTGGGGMHAIYLRGEFPIRHKIDARKNIDIIANGYIIAPPSVHYTSRAYKWINQIAPVVQPEVLVEIANERKVIESSPATAAPRQAMADKPSRITAAALIANDFPVKGSRHVTFLALSGALAKEGWTEDEIVDFCMMVARLIPNEGFSMADREDTAHKQARDSIAKVQSGEQVAGWGSLSEHIPQTTIVNVWQRLGIAGSDYDYTNDPKPNAAIEAIEQPITFGDQTITPEEVNAAAKVNPADPQVHWIGEIAKRRYPPVLSYKTPYPTLNRLLGGGISTQQLAILLGRPAAGKTAFFTSLALYCSTEVPVLYVSTELQHNELVARLASPLIKTTWRDIVRDRTGELSLRAEKALEHHRIAIIAQDEIYQAGERAVELIARTAYKIKTMNGGVAPIVMVDYLQELARGDDSKARQQNTKVAVTFRMLSQRLDAAIICVSSVSRAGYGKASAELRASNSAEVYLSLAKESGDIDYAAATIMFLDALDETDGNGYRLGRIAVCKSRHGETGFCGMRFYGSYGEWSECAAGITALSADALNGQRNEKALDDFGERLRGKVRELSMLGLDPRGNSSLKPRTELKAVIGGNTQQVTIALERELREGRLVERYEHGSDVNGKPRHRKVIDLPPADGSAPAYEAPLDIGAALAGIVGGSVS